MVKLKTVVLILVMSKPRKKQGNPDFRHRVTSPAPSSHYPMRQVSVLWGQTWYHYLTNVLDPQQLSPQQLYDLYRRRWKIEDAFLLTKRLLGLSYLWVGGTNGVQMLSLCYMDFLCCPQ